LKATYKGKILLVRVVEDTIRATRKYTKGAFSYGPRHPIQGAEFPSRVLTEYYEVYPNLEVGWDMDASRALSWLLGFGDTPYIDVRFEYDYRTDAAKVIVHGGEFAVRELTHGIPGFAEALDQLEGDTIHNERRNHQHMGRNKKKGCQSDGAAAGSEGHMVDPGNRVRDSAVSRP